MEERGREGRGKGRGRRAERIVGTGLPVGSAIANGQESRPR